MTFPMITSSMAERSIPERFTASRMATAPSSGAVSGARPPRNFPIGVRAAETMTGCRDVSVMWFRAPKLRGPASKLRRAEGPRDGQELAGKRANGSVFGEAGYSASDRVNHLEKERPKGRKLHSPF